ncbi:hypothetical protein [Paucibacter soli]|uniref:hypothetical protein n=1 Tax=Paucibacter soli TaxID=3133433 RepID=UPI0030AD96DB
MFAPARCFPGQPGMPAQAARRGLLLGALAAIGLPGLARAQAGAGAMVAIPSDVQQDYERFVGAREPLQISQYGGPHARRDVVEFVLLQQALVLGGYTQPMGLLSMPSSARLQLEVRTGHAVCSATSYWREDFPAAEQELMFSQAVLAEGEFEVGLYTAPGNARALAARSLSDLRALTFLSNRDWRVDWRTLEQLGIAKLMHAGNWDLMPRMVASGRADVLLAPFQPGTDLALEVRGTRLLAIPGLKIGMRGTRHYLLSARHPQGQAVKAALDAGLGQLRRQGVLRKAYEQSGFINSATEHWQRL